MTQSLKFAKFAVGLMMVFSWISCSDDDEGTEPEVNTPQTIADFVAQNENYSTLAAALEMTELTATLDGSAAYTVFAPDNAAFSAFLEANGFTSLEDVPESLLTEVLLNHVQSGVIMSDDLNTGYIQSMATGMASEEPLSMYIEVGSGVTINGVSNVTMPDVAVENGVIHAVDAVIGLPNIVTFALADPTFDVLTAALTREAEYPFVEVLMQTEDPAPFTVFAPTNDAFVALLEELDLESLEDIPANDLATVLSYHVVPTANVRSSELTDGMTVSTLAEQSFTVDLGTGPMLMDVAGRTANIIVVDVQANNGVIHVLDKVLLPEL